MLQTICLRCDFAEDVFDQSGQLVLEQDYESYQHNDDENDLRNRDRRFLSQK